MPGDYHLAAYFEAIDNTANTDVNALTDDVLTISNNHFLLRDDWYLAWARAGSATLSRARIFSPSIGFNGAVRPYLAPVDVSLLPSSPVPVVDYTTNPLRLKREEELALEATSAVAMGTENFYGIIGIWKRFNPAPPGDVVLLRGTSSTTPVASTWTTLTTTWETNLPQGRYAVVGGHMVASVGEAWRLIIPGQVPRPGGLCVTSAGGLPWSKFLDGRMGNWGEFQSFVMPQVQVLANAATAITEVFLALVKIG